VFTLLILRGTIRFAFVPNLLENASDKRIKSKKHARRKNLQLAVNNGTTEDNNELIIRYNSFMREEIFHFSIVNVHY
jgi:hypothetical protein